jgi:hypothetical protein
LDEKAEVTTQTDEWADEEHLPSFGTRAKVYGLNGEEAQRQQKKRKRQKSQGQQKFENASFAISCMILWTIRALR